MTTWLITHPSCLQHDTGPGHPENIGRLQAVLAALEDPAFQFLQRVEARPATLEELSRVHERGYVERLLQQMPERGYRALDADTMVCPASGEAALYAAGAVCTAVDAVMGKETVRAFCAVRPPGHHAEPSRAMGFCLFNNIAVGAAHAREVHKVKRVAVVDFDVHHGNGTQRMLGDKPGYLYLSIHQSPLFPGTGLFSGEGGMNIHNVLLPPDSGGNEFRYIFQDGIIEPLKKFKPQLILVSAGFDGHVEDPMAGLRLRDGDFEWATDEIVKVARKYCKGRLVSTLEGGYNHQALARSVAGHVRALL